MSVSHILFCPLVTTDYVSLSCSDKCSEIKTFFCLKINLLTNFEYKPLFFITPGTADMGIRTSENIFGVNFGVH